MKPSSTFPRRNMSGSSIFHLDFHPAPSTHIVLNFLGQPLKHFNCVRQLVTKQKCPKKCCCKGDIPKNLEQLGGDYVQNLRFIIKNGSTPLELHPENHGKKTIYHISIFKKTNRGPSPPSLNGSSSKSEPLEFHPHIQVLGKVLPLLASETPEIMQLTR